MASNIARRAIWQHLAGWLGGKGNISGRATRLAEQCTAGWATLTVAGNADIASGAISESLYGVGGRAKSLAMLVYNGWKIAGSTGLHLLANCWLTIAGLRLLAMLACN